MKKYSKQREEILLFLKESYAHPTADEVYDAVKENDLTISKGTVYRNLALLVDEKVIIKIPVHNGSDRYDYMKTEHHHIVCKTCGIVADFNYHINVEQLKETVKEQTNMEMTSNDFLMYGICNQCKQNVCLDC